MPIYFCINCTHRGMEPSEEDPEILVCPVCGAFSPKDDTPIMAGEKS